MLSFPLLIKIVETGPLPLSILDSITTPFAGSETLHDFRIQVGGQQNAIFKYSAGATGNEGGESSVLRTYKFFDVFPITVGEIALSYDTTDALEEFDVTFRYQYFTIGNSAQSSGGTGEVLIT